MLKRIFSLVLVSLLAFSVSAQAAEARIARGTPSLTFNGTTATCKATCRSDATSDKISATLTLYQGTTRVASWSDSGTGSVTISQTKSVTKGKEYKLVLSYSVNGTTQSEKSVTGKC